MAAAGCAVLMAGCATTARPSTSSPEPRSNGPGVADGGKPAVFTVQRSVGRRQGVPPDRPVQLRRAGRQGPGAVHQGRAGARVGQGHRDESAHGAGQAVQARSALARAHAAARSNQPRRYRVWASISRPTAGKDFALDVASAPVVVTVRPTGTASAAPAANAAPVADYIIDRAPAVAGATATFDARQSTDDIGIVKYEWDLYGDGDYERLTYTPQAQFAVGPKAERAAADEAAGDRQREPELRLRRWPGAGGQLEPRPSSAPADPPCPPPDRSTRASRASAAARPTRRPTRPSCSATRPWSTRWLRRRTSSRRPPAGSRRPGSRPSRSGTARTRRTPCTPPRPSTA